MAVLVFWAAVGFVLYTLIGYPLLLGWLARHRARPIRKKWLPRTVTVVIAVRNGARWIENKLASIRELDYPPELLDVVVVSDGSTDDTEALVQTAGPGVALVRIPPGGKALAITAALLHARGEILLLTDVRQRLEPGGLKKLIACFADPAVGVVSGDLILRAPGSEEQVNIGLYRRWETWLRDCLGQIDTMFGATGAYYAMRRELAIPLPPGTLLDDMYLPLAAFRRGYRLIMEPAAQAFDEPVALRAEFWRKVRTLAGNYQIIMHYPELALPWRRMAWHFLSYKAARLILPYALIAVTISSCYLPPPWRTWALAGQVLFYGLALVDQLLPEGAFAKRLTSPAWTFVVMMTAAFCAPAIFFVPAQRLWKPTDIKPKAAA